MLNVDCTSLYKDFRKSYTLLKRKLRNKTLSGHVQNNINLLLVQSRDKSDRAFNEYLPATLRDISPPSGTTTYIPDDVRRQLQRSFNKAISSSITGASGASMMTQEAAEALKKSEEEPTI